MKKLLIALLCAGMVLSFCGCAPEEPNPVTPPVSDPVQPDPAPGPVQPDPVPGPAVQPDPPSGEVPGDGNAQYEQPNEALRIEEKYETKTFSAGGRVVVHLDLNYPYADGKGVTADCIREYYDLWAQRQLESAEFDLLPQAESQFNGMQDGAFMPYSVNWSFDTTRFDEKVVSVLQTGYRQTGGAHPQNLLAAQNFNAENGGLLALGDLFTVEEAVYMETIRTLVLPMMQQREQKEEAFYYGGYEGYMMQVFNPADFCLTETGLRLFWQTDSIAPHAAGVQIFDLPFQQLGDILDAKWK